MHWHRCMRIDLKVHDCFRDRVKRANDLHLKRIDPKVRQLPHRPVHDLIGLGRSHLINHVGDQIKKPLICLARVQPESSVNVELVSLELIDQPGNVIDLVSYQRCLIDGSTPCAASVIAASRRVLGTLYDSSRQSRWR
jgi:hypothetical protein